jgi:hypothetical protein
MATAYTAQSYLNANRIQSDGGDFTQYFYYSMSAAFVINDTVALEPIPGASGVILLDWLLVIPALDSSTGSAVSLGDGTTADAFMAATAAGQSSAGSTFYSQKDGVQGYLPKSYPAASGNKTFTLKITTGPSGTGTTSGVIKGWVRYNMIGITPLV